MLARSLPPGEEKKVSVLKCCSRFVSFHLLCNESCYCCKRQRDLTGSSKLSHTEGGREGEEKRSMEEKEKPTRPHFKTSEHFGDKKCDKEKLFYSLISPFFLFLLLLLLLLTAPHPSQMKTLAQSSAQKLKQRSLREV